MTGLDTIEAVRRYTGEMTPAIVVWERTSLNRRK
jgi:hypothetical protein